MDFHNLVRKLFIILQMIISMVCAPLNSLVRELAALCFHCCDCICSFDGYVYSKIIINKVPTIYHILRVYVFLLTSYTLPNY